MKKKGIVIAIIVGLVVILGIALISANNNLVSLEAEVDAALADIDTNLQRRADLIPADRSYGKRQTVLSGPWSPGPGLDRGASLPEFHPRAGDA